MIEGLFKNESLKNAMLKTVVSKFQSQGIEKLIVFLNEKGEIDYEPMGKNDAVCPKEKLDFLQNFYEENKHLVKSKKQ